jgi:hypothetical protein
MRQAWDQRWADLLHRLWFCQPTEEDIELLISRIGAQLPDSAAVTIIVRRNELRHALNLRRLHYLARSRHTPVLFCREGCIAGSGLPPQDLQTQGWTQQCQVIPGAPLMVK